LASRMRERLDEITSRLGVELPVYLLITKCDLISGFVDVFGSMSAADRRKIWGFTSPLLSAMDESPAEQFSTQFQLLCKNLEQFSVQQMAQEVRADVLVRMYEFPAQFRSLEEKLVAFADELFAESAYGESPVLRGAYFTSGTQEGAPADLLIEQMASAMNVRPLLNETEEEKKSYFLHDMLMDVVFEDRDVASASQIELKRQQTRRRIITSSLFAGALLLAALPTISSHKNLYALAQTRELATRIGDAPMPLATSLVPARLDDVSALKAEAERYEDGLPSIFASFGLYQGGNIQGPLVRYFGAALKEWVVRPLVNRSNQTLITVTAQREGLRLSRSGDQPLDDASRESLTSALKLHLLLSAPKDDCAPDALARKDWLLAQLMTLWNAAAPSTDRQEVVNRKALLLRYVEMLSQHPDELSFGRDVHRVELARRALAQEDKASSLLSVVLDRFGKEPRSLAQLSGASAVLTSTVSANSAFTLDTWNQISREVASGKSWSFGDESWVLGCDQESADKLRAARQSGAFQDQYLKRYEGDWKSFVQGISSRAPATAAEAEGMLIELVGRPGVLGVLFQRIKENTELPPPPPEDVKSAALDVAAKALDTVTTNNTALSGIAGLNKPVAAANPALDRLRNAFAELTRFGVQGAEGTEPALEQYRRQLEPVLQAVHAYREDESKVEELTAATKTAIGNTEMLLTSHPSPWTGRLREILLPPLAGLLNITTQNRGGQLQRQWCELVFRPMQQELAGRYPWQADSTSAVSAQAFERFFQPDSGVIWSFVAEQLNGYVVQEGNRFVFGGARGAEARALLRDDLLSFLNRALALRQAFFPGKNPTLRVPYRVRVRGAAGYSLTTFAAGGRSVRYDSGNEVWTPMEWPGDQPSEGATLAVVPYQGAAPKPLVLSGEWGLFLILDELHGHAQILEHNERSLTAGWKPKGSQNWVKVDFAWDDPHSPLASVPLGRAGRGLLPVVAPPRVAHSGSGC
ncbi:MAG: hypothetical protein JWN04_4165, partial [Myxococcaceae bacterium]|nr:hypothetical protein [Myxococcaceae bacterium]